MPRASAAELAGSDAEVRGMEALHKGGVEDRTVTGAVDQLLRLLPRGNERADRSC